MSQTACFQRFFLCICLTSIFLPGVSSAYTPPSSVLSALDKLRGYSELTSAAGSMDIDVYTYNLTTWQMSHGGFSKAYAGKYVKPYDGSSALSEWTANNTPLGMFDNNATVQEMRLLAVRYKATTNSSYKSKFKESFNKAVGFILASQLPNGGWPQVFPKRNNYSDLATYNDNAMVRVMVLVKDIIDKKSPFDTDLVSSSDISKLQTALNKAVDFALKAQIVNNGNLTVWCAQHNPSTYAPAGARSYELPSKSGSESVPIVYFLMAWPEQTTAIQNAVKGAIAWYKKTHTPDLKFSNGQFVSSPGASLWYRFYNVEDDRQFFCDRDGVKTYDFMSVSEERRTGYQWGGDYGSQLLSMESAYLNALGSSVKYNLTVSVAQGQGTITPSSGSFESGASVTLTATPAGGFLFDRWGGDLSGSTNPATVTMNGNKSISAYFVQDTRNYYTVTKQANPGGSITQNPEGNSLAEGTSVTLTAVPNSGWTFSGWSGDHSGTDATYTVSSLNRNISVSASFIPIDRFVYQAENGVLNEAVFETKNAGFTGDAYVNFNPAEGASVRIPVYTDAAGQRVCTVTFSNGSGSARALSASVNGTQQIASVQFEATADWTAWQSKQVILSLPQGASTITLATINGQDGPNIDKLTLDQGTSAADNLTIDVKPVSFYISSQKTLCLQADPSKKLSVSIFSLSGKKVFSKSFSGISGAEKLELPLNGLRSGKYLLRLEQSGTAKSGHINLL
ncbi:MAG: pectate lyase [Fibrobacter sp.]|nr:pectate lyase [Fibrobacter sp.]